MLDLPNLSICRIRRGNREALAEIGHIGVALTSRGEGADQIVAASHILARLWTGEPGVKGGMGFYEATVELGPYARVCEPWQEAAKFEEKPPEKSAALWRHGKRGASYVASFERIGVSGSNLEVSYVSKSPNQSDKLFVLVVPRERAVLAVRAIGWVLDSQDHARGVYQAYLRERAVISA